MGKDRKSRRCRSPSASSSSPSSSSCSSDDSYSVKRRMKKRRSSRYRERTRHRSAKEKGEERRERSRRDKREMRGDRLREGRSGSDVERHEPDELVRLILQRFPNVAGDLKHLLQMIDDGQGVDIKGITSRSLSKLLKKLFQSLNLEQSENGFFSLPLMSAPTLKVVGPTISSDLKPKNNHPSMLGSPDRQQISPSFVEHESSKGVGDVAVPEDASGEQDCSAPSRRRLIGPEMPSRELLAAAAELTKAETLLREAEVDGDNGLFVGPPPPAIVAEAESANEAERFEEVERIAGADADKPYDVLGVNWKMSSDNIKKRYWKLSLMVHPDKCSHPRAHQAFVILNQAFKDLQDTDKRKAIDEKIKLKEEQEQLEVELKVLREAARWRQLQGISIEGDEELLAATKEPPRRDEWMTQLPPERKPGIPMQSTSFSRTTKEGRGDTSAWTDCPSDRAEKAKMNYLEAYSKAKAISNMDDDRKRKSSFGNLVDEYNASKRPVSLVQKHQEKIKHPKKKSKEPEKEEWVGLHPWKPWDRETDLSAGRKKVNFDSENMTQGLSSRFSSGSTQRNFL